MNKQDYPEVEEDLKESCKEGNPSFYFVMEIAKNKVTMK